MKATYNNSTTGAILIQNNSYLAKSHQTKKSQHAQKYEDIFICFSTKFGAAHKIFDCISL